MTNAFYKETGEVGYLPYALDGNYARDLCKTSERRCKLSVLDRGFAKYQCPHTQQWVQVKYVPPKMMGCVKGNKLLNIQSTLIFQEHQIEP